MDFVPILEKKSIGIGEELHTLAAELFPICRSITGEGIRQTLATIANRIPLSLVNLSSGTEVFDWTVPKEWNIRDAFVSDSYGNRIIDFRRNNLHVVNYSTPVDATMSLDSLKPHLFTIEEKPDFIPYRTSYYKEDWGFCLSHNQLLSMKDNEYRVRIDSSLTDGVLTYGECYLPGFSTDEVLISAHCCHPSLANDNLSGVTVAVKLAELMTKQKRRYSYRFLFIPGTIGAIAWLAMNKAKTENIRHGIVLTGIGDSGKFHYKRSRRGDAEIDRAFSHLLRYRPGSEVLPFSPYGYDERQYCSPGFNLPVGCLMRSLWGAYPEYHTSADNLDFIKPMQLAESLQLCAELIDLLEHNYRYRNVQPFCEPQLGRRNLYSSVGGRSITAEIHARLWVLNLSDGNHSLLDIAEESGLRFSEIADAALLLSEAGLLLREDSFEVPLSCK